MKLNTIYTTFQGEVNAFGIGAPVIFLRLQGCHLRCYLKTKGVLCDTPEGLEADRKNPTSISEIIYLVKKEREQHGINLVTLTGGDPLWNKIEDVTALLKILTDEGFDVSVETSGSLSWLPYTNISNKIYWVLDYKLSSCGLNDSATKYFLDSRHLRSLNETDYIKFVIESDEDVEQAIEIINNIKDKTLARIAVGPYWGEGSISALEVFDRFKGLGLLGRVVMNFQVHKLVVSPNYSSLIPKEI